MENGIQKILVAAALDDDGSKVLQQAASMAKVHGASLAVVHVIEPLSEFGQSLVNTYLAPEAGEALHEKNFTHIREEMQRRLEQHCQGVDASDIRVVEGRSEAMILAVADEVDADLVVMGAHRHSRATEAILGTTTFRVLHAATRPVLVIPAGD